MARNYAKGYRLLNCVAGGVQCGGRCLAPGMVCHINDGDTKDAVKRLVSSVPRKMQAELKKKGMAIPSHITHEHAIIALAVFKSPFTFQDMKGGKHPLLTINKNITDKQVNDLHDQLKAEGVFHKQQAKEKGLAAPFTILEKIRNAGIRNDNSIKSEAREKIYLRLWLEQGGRDFYTGAKLNVNKGVLDHITPLSKGGTNTANNLVLTSQNFNFWKGATESKREMAIRLEKKAYLGEPDMVALYKKLMGSSIFKADQKSLDQFASQYAKNVAENDNKQGKALLALRGTNANTLSKFSNFGWAQLNTPPKLEPLTPTEVSKALKAQKAENGTVRTWVRSSTQSPGTALSSGNANVGRVIIGGVNGLLPGDIPRAWLESFNKTYIDNTHLTGNLNVRKSLGPNWTEHLDKLDQKRAALRSPSVTSSQPTSTSSKELGSFLKSNIKYKKRNKEQLGFRGESAEDAVKNLPSRVKNLNKQMVFAMKKEDTAIKRNDYSAREFWGKTQKTLEARLEALFFNTHRSLHTKLSPLDAVRQLEERRLEPANLQQAKSFINFTQLTGKIPETLQTIRINQNPDSDFRASAYPTYQNTKGYISLSPLTEKSTIYHESGHHIEFSDKNLKQKANDFLARKSQGVEKLSVITGQRAYKDEEIAHKGKFVHPYVGKIYPDGSTEVFSVGFEYMSAPKKMLHLYLSDREHFNLTLEALGYTP